MYILRISSKAFIRMGVNEVVVTPKYESATIYETIGEAMKVASMINYDLENPIVRVVPIGKTSVSSKL